MIHANTQGDSHVPSQDGRQFTVSGKPSSPYPVVRLTVCLDNMFIAAIFCPSSAQAARKLSNLAGPSRATYMRHHIVTTVLLRPMSRSKDSRVFYRRFDRQRPRRTVPRRRTCGGSYIPLAFPTILKMTHPVHTMRRIKKQSTLSRRTNPSYRSLLLCPSSVRPNQHILATVIEDILKPSTKHQVPSLQVLPVETALRLHRL